MKKLHYYQVLLLLGSLLAGALYAAHSNNDQDDEKYPAPNQQASANTFYEHGDLTFFDREKSSIDENELKNGLIKLSQQIKATGKRKVYLFIGVAGSGKSRSIQALQGNKIKKRKETGLCETTSSSDDDSDKQVQDKLLIDKRISPDLKIPTVGSGCRGETDSTYIYYPDSSKSQYQGMAFADTEGFFGKRKTTSAGKCLSAISFPYTLKANEIGGLILVVSASELDTGRGEEGMQHIAYILEQYFAKGVSEKKMRESILIMITKVTTKQGKGRVKRKLKELIQLFYKEYYAKPDDNQKYYAKPENNVSGSKDKIVGQTTAELASNVVGNIVGNVIGGGSVGQVIGGAAKVLAYTAFTGLPNNKGKRAGKSIRKGVEKDEDLKKERKKQDEEPPLKLADEPENNVSGTKDKMISQTADLASDLAGGVISGVSNVMNLVKLNNNTSEQIKKNVKKLCEKGSEQCSLELFYEMLLKQDVPEDKINSLSNFELDKRKYCFIFPWREKNVQKILDEKLKNLKPIASDDLYTFDNPVSQYIEKKILAWSHELNEATQPLLKLRQSVDSSKNKLMSKRSKGAVNEITIEALAKVIQTTLDKKIENYNNFIKNIKNHDVLEVVFQQSHYGRLPKNEGFVTKFVGEMVGYKLYKKFRYTGKEPIYKISAIYGPKACLSEELPAWSWSKKSEFNFIKKHFNIIIKESDNGMVKWEAKAKKDKSVAKNEWVLYHITTGKHNAQCNIKFYARRNERVSSKRRVKDAQNKIKSLKQELNERTKEINAAKISKKKWKIKRDKMYKKWKGVVHMLQFFADSILKEGEDKALIETYLNNFNEATQLVLPMAENKINNQKNKSYQAGACNQEPDDEEVFDID